MSIGSEIADFFSTKTNLNRNAEEKIPSGFIHPNEIRERRNKFAQKIRDQKNS
jgi:hypothetical protein